MAGVYKMDRCLKRDKGYILIEMIVALGLFWMLFTVLWTSYLSIYKTYKKESQKAYNLEEARQVVTFLTDTFQRYEAGYCFFELGEEGLIKKIVFQEKNGSNKQVISYSKTNEKVTFQKQEIGRAISDFKVMQRGELYDFVIEVETIRIGTTVNLKYMDRLE